MDFPKIKSKQQSTEKVSYSFKDDKTYKMRHPEIVEDLYRHEFKNKLKRIE